MKIEIKKIENKIELDTTTEGCLNDCLELIWAAYSEETSMEGVANCLYGSKYTAKGNIFF